MKISKYISTIISCTLLVVTACKKETAHPGNAANGQIAFINASAQLFSDLGYNGNAYVLIDKTDTTYHPVSIVPDMPYLNKDNKYQYPSARFNASLAQPWVTYLNISPGTHEFRLVDTSHYLRAMDKLNLNPNWPVSIYYADSLGYFRSFVLQDQLVNEPGNVRLRFLDLSPDAGKVFFTIDEKPASYSGFAKSYAYGNASSFINYPNPKTDTLRVNFYQSADSTTVVASAFVQAVPNRSYTLILQGYFSQSVSYPDPKNSNNYKNLTGGLSVLINTNN